MTGRSAFHLPRPRNQCPRNQCPRPRKHYLGDLPRPCRRRYRRSGAFSLVEILVVFVLIGLLAGLIVVNVRSYLARGKREAARNEIAKICEALEAYRTMNGSYPTQDEGLALLLDARANDGEALLKGNRKLVDPWGTPYQYNIPGRNNEPYEVISFGELGQEGGEGGEADIVSWDLKDSGE